MAIQIDSSTCRNLEASSKLEWLLTDGTGGYAMGTVSGINTRRYHGHLVAAVTPPADRMVLLAAIEAFAEISGATYPASTNQYPGAVHPDGYRHLSSFEAFEEEVTWTFDLGGNHLMKRIRLTPEGVHVVYENHSERQMRLSLRPLVCHKPYHQNFHSRDDYPSHFAMDGNAMTIGFAKTALRLVFEGAECQAVHGWYYRFEHQRESERGLDPLDDLFCPCELGVLLQPGKSWTLQALHGGGKAPNVKRSSPFLVRSQERTTLIAGYPWFTDWGRDTMISLPGICLQDGLFEEARNILRGYADKTRQGLIPNRFVEQDGELEYNTVDASLWFINAIYLTLKAEWNKDFALDMLSQVQHIIDWYRKGTLYGIGVDPEDGLVRQGEPGYQLTWMDAKVGEWVITPRTGKPVEINGLWIQALRVLAWLKEQLSGDPTTDRKAADEAEASFHAKFWNEELGWYRDTVDDDSDLLRPNQVIALSLEFGPLDKEKSLRAMDSVEQHLLTPYGLRTLAPFEPGYRTHYEGPLPELDVAYHQGTVWPWLLGIYAMAHQRVHGKPFHGALPEDALTSYGLGGIAEVYDADPPHRPNGCPWQAWSYATLRQAGIIGSS